MFPYDVPKKYGQCCYIQFPFFALFLSINFFFLFAGILFIFRSSYLAANAVRGLPFNWSKYLVIIFFWFNLVKCHVKWEKRTIDTKRFDSHIEQFEQIVGVFTLCSVSISFRHHVRLISDCGNGNTHSHLFSAICWLFLFFYALQKYQTKKPHHFKEAHKCTSIENTLKCRQSDGRHWWRARERMKYGKPTSERKNINLK